MAFELLGKDFIPPDIQAKVTGKAKYAEDFRAEGMVFCKLLTSPAPHARISNIDASEALAMPGVLGVLTADEVNPLVRALRENGIEVTAIHSHMLEEQPRLFFVHFWADDDSAKLARGLRAALDKMAVARS